MLQIASAILRGALLKGRAQAIAMLEAKSPWEVSAGISTTKSGSSFEAGSAPASTALSSAASSSCATDCLVSAIGLVMLSHILYIHIFCRPAARGSLFGTLPCGRRPALKV